jgi:hypothetical protein
MLNLNEKVATISSSGKGQQGASTDVYKVSLSSSSSFFLSLGLVCLERLHTLKLPQSKTKSNPDL